MNAPICKKCGKPLYNDFTGTGVDLCDCPDQEEKEENQSPCYGNYGWICPICGAGLSPALTVCPNCSGLWPEQPWKITYGPTSGGTYIPNIEINDRG